MSKPAISVVIPCFNSEVYIGETIGSVLKQSFQDLEIIVVDDGSTDSSLQIIQSFGSKVRLESSDHGGASAARNRGTELAQGDFIQYLDADDLLRPEAITKRFRALEMTHSDVAYSNWQELEEVSTGEFKSGKIHSQKIEDIHPDVEIALFTDFWAPPAAILYRKSIVDKINGWNLALPVIQDARFLFDAGLHGGKFIHIPEIGADYRVHLKDSLSRRNPEGFMKDIFTNAIQIEKIWKDRGELTHDQKNALSSTYEFVARHLFELQSSEFDSSMQRLKALGVKSVFRYPFVAHSLKSLMGYRAARSLMSVFKGVNHQFKRIRG